MESERLRTKIGGEQDKDDGTGDWGDDSEKAKHRGKRKLEEGEIRALQSGTEGEQTDCGADQRAAGDSERECDPGVDAVAHLQDGADVRAGAEEGCMAEGILPAVAAEHVPALPHQRDQQRHGEKIEY